MQLMCPRWVGKRRRKRNTPLLSRDVTHGTLWYRGKNLLLCRHRKAGIWAFAVERGGVYIGPERFIDAPGEMAKMKRKKKVPANSEVAHLAPVESTIFGKYQSIIAHMADLKYDDGTPRQPGTVTLKTMGSAWVVTLKDPDECMLMNIIQATFDEAITLASLMLESEDAPWEVDQWAVAARAKKRK